MSDRPKLDPIQTWRGSFRDVQFKISLHGVGGSFMPKGTYCFYLYLHEGKCTDFAALWLTPKLSRFSPKSPERVSYDYMASKLGDIAFHGGITYYEPLGQVAGHRCVEVGCDYAHLYDDEKDWCERAVLTDVIEAINSCYDLDILKPETVKQERSHE
jgi:hypothetical protein